MVSKLEPRLYNFLLNSTGFAILIYYLIVILINILIFKGADLEGFLFCCDVLRV